MQLTCPTCRSGLEVPDGTTAQVRCPTCKTVFAPAGVAAPPRADEPPRRKTRPRADEDDRPRRPRTRAGEDDDDRPRKTRRRAGDGEDRGDRDVDTSDADRPDRGRRRPQPKDGLTPEQRVARVARFRRGMWGAKLVWVSLLCYGGSMLLLCVFHIHTAVSSAVGGVPGGNAPAAYYYVAGILGLCNWASAAVGVGLCLSGPPAPGLHRFGVSAAVAAACHLVVLLVLVAQTGGGGPDADEVRGVLRWRQLATQLDTLSTYLTVIAYPENVPPGSRAVIGLGLTAGTLEVVRMVFLTMTLGSLARAAGYKELNGRCVRAAGYAAWGPVAVALVELLTMVAMVETGGQNTGFGKIILSVMVLGVTALLTGTLIPSMSAARDVTEACESPFQAETIDLGG